MSRAETISVHISEYVEIDMADIGTDSLVNELLRRGRSEESLPGDTSSIIQRMHVGLKLKQNDVVLECARLFVVAHLGVIL